MLDPSLTTIDHANLTLDGTGTIALAQLATFTVGTFALSGGTASLSGLTDADGSSFVVSAGSTLTLGALASYAGGVNYTSTFQATGAGSVLALPKLASVTADTGQYYSLFQVQALAGGNVQIPALTTISGGPVALESDGAGSKLDVPALTSFQGHIGQGSPSRLQVSNGGMVRDPDLARLGSVGLVGDATGTFTLSASLGLSISGGTSTFQIGTLADQGNLGVQAGATLNIEGGFSLNGSGILTTAPGSTIEVSGNLLGTTKNADDFQPQGTVAFDSGTGTTSPPQLLEAMSVDLGAVQAGFVDNFAYGTISLTANTSVELVDQSHNTTSTTPEAVYANELIVPHGATLNLNGLHFYVRGDQISGNVVGGTVVVVPSGGSIALNTPTPGTLNPAGAVDNWTFYGTAGESFTVQLNPGGSGSAPAPRRNWTGEPSRCWARPATCWPRRPAPRAGPAPRSAAWRCRPQPRTRSRSRRRPATLRARATTSSRPTT